MHAHKPQATHTTREIRDLVKTRIPAAEKFQASSFLFIIITSN